MGRRKFLAFEGHRMDGMGIGGVGFIRDGYGSTLQVDFGGQVHKYLSIYLTHTISLSLSLYTKIRGGGGVTVFLLFVLSWCEKRVGSWQRRNRF